MGDVVGLLSPNSSAFAIAFHGILRSGATATTINALFTAKDIAKQLTDSKATVLVTVSALLPQAAEAAEAVDLGFADRLAEYRRNEFYFVGVRAVAEIEINGIRQTISSGGLWGIESDSDEAYLQEVYAEQREELDAMLVELGLLTGYEDEELPTIEDYQREANEPRGG